MNLTLQAEHHLAHAILGDVSVSVFEMDGDTAVALRYGDFDAPDTPLVRIQSACTYGEVLLAADCDCREQLLLTFEKFKEHGSGVLVYLNQEGRGAGLVSKARAYALQERKGLDTVEAYLELHLDPDQRDYTVGCDILLELGVKRLKLLTNNYRKVDQVSRHYEEMSVESLITPVTDCNRSYLQAKQSKLGHKLNLEPMPVAR